MSFTKKRWLILISSCIINLCIGSIYAWSVFSLPLAEHINAAAGTALTSADLAVVFTAYNAMTPIIVIFGGAVDDKIGPKAIAIVGAVLFGAGTILSGMVTSVPLLVITYGVMGAIGINLCYVCTVSNTIKIFPDRRGLVGGLTTATYGLSSVIVPLIANHMMEDMALDVTATFRILGIAYLVIILLCATVQSKCPEGYVPEGYVPPQDKEHLKNSHDEDWKEMLHDARFYPMVILMFCATFFGTMVISQASPIARDMVGMSTGAAAAAVSVLALFNAAGRIVAGTVSDRIGRLNTLVIALTFALCGLILLTLTGVGQVVLFYIGMALVGVAYGAFMSILPGFSADQFGQTHSAVNYGILDLGYAAAGIIGPMLVSTVYLSTGSYDPAFLIAALIAILGFSMTFLFRHLLKVRAAREEATVPDEKEN